ncbi:MAG: synthase subunit delta, partial [Actinomycetota bacterium]
MSTQQINAYVTAMYEVAVANDAVAAVEDEMFRLARAYESNDQLRASLGDSSLPTERRQKIVEQLLGGKA